MSDERALPDGSAQEPGARKEDASLERPAKIRLLYESVDGKLCLFEDGQGHLTAVRASKLA